MLTALLLAALTAVPMTPAEPEPAVSPISLLLFWTGGGVKVLGYSVDGDLIHATDLDGNPVVMRAEKIHLEASRAATRKFQRLLLAEARQRAEQQAAARKARPLERVPAKTLLEASREARANGRTGSLSAMGGERWTPPAGPIAVQDASGNITSASDLAVWQTTHVKLRAEVDRLEGQVRRYDARIERSDEVCRKLGTMSTACAFERGNLVRWQEELDPIQADLTAARRALRSFERKARAAGVELEPSKR